MIEIMQGSPGSGKSAVAVARALMHIRKGGIVAANFSLVDGWSDVLAKRHVLSYLSDQYRYDLSASYYQRFLYVSGIDGIKSIQPRELSVGVYSDKKSYSEGHGLLILDEAQLVFNSRTWKDNAAWIEFFTQHRKIGWNVLLIAHSIEMIDSQIRPLAEYESRFRNLQKVKFPIIGLPMSPIPLFVVIRRYAGLGAGASVIADREACPLPLWAARLYDSLQVFSFDTSKNTAPPSLCGQPPSPPLCGGRGSLTKKKERVSQISPYCFNTLWETQQTSP